MVNIPGILRSLLKGAVGRIVSFMNGGRYGSRLLPLSSFTLNRSMTQLVLRVISESTWLKGFLTEVDWRHSASVGGFRWQGIGPGELPCDCEVLRMIVGSELVYIRDGTVLKRWKGVSAWMEIGVLFSLLAILLLYRFIRRVLKRRK